MTTAVKKPEVTEDELQAQIEAELAKLAVIVAKTGGDQEREAFELLRQHVENE